MTRGHTARPPELDYFGLLLRAAMLRQDPPEPAVGIDWDRFSGWLDRHHMVAPFIAPVIGRSTVPTRIKAKVAAAAAGCGLLVRIMLAELKRIFPPLEQAGCLPVVLKGAALHFTHYRSPARYFIDIDLLVLPASIHRAVAVLRGLGYQMDEAAPPADWYEKYHFHFRLKSPGGLLVELHWDLTRKMDYVRFDVDSFIARSRVVAADGLTLRVPSDADQLLHAAAQDFEEGFMNLRRVVDAAHLLVAGAGSDLDIAEAARHRCLAVPLWLLLLCVRELMGVAPTAELETAIQPRKFARVCLTSLDIPGKALSCYVLKRSGLSSLLLWLCAPDTMGSLRQIRRFLFPSKAEFIAHGFGRRASPRLGERAGLAMRRSWSLLKLIGYQSYCVAEHEILIQAGRVTARRE